MGDESEYLDDYNVMTADGYAFRVEQQEPKGKLLRALRPLAADEELLQEIPLIVWPIAASLLPSSLFCFCENCMQLQQPPAYSNLCDGSESHSSSSSTSTTLTETTGSSCTVHTTSHLTRTPHGKGGATTDGEEGIVVLVGEGEPPCWFCSAYCRAAALGSSVAGELTSVQQQQEQQQHQLPMSQQQADDNKSDSCTYAGRSQRKRKAPSLEGAALDESFCVGTGSADDTAVHVTPAAHTMNAAGEKKEQTKEEDNSLSLEPPQQSTHDNMHLLGGWLRVLRPSLLRRLREKEQFAWPQGNSVEIGSSAIIPSLAAAGALASAAAGAAAAAAEHSGGAPYGNPLPTEALARAIARIAAQTHALQDLAGLSPLDAYNVACRPFMRLAQRRPQQMPPAEQQQMLRDLLLLPLKETVGEEIANALLSDECLERLYGALVVNSQALNVWGVAAATGQFMLLRAGGVYTLHACMNHSCEPNCRVLLKVAATKWQQQQQEFVHITQRNETSIAPATAEGDEGHPTGVVKEAEAAPEERHVENSAPAAQQHSAFEYQQQQEVSTIDCDSAAAGGGEGSLLSIETTRAVEAGEELCVSYVDTRLPFERRQQLLWDTYGFMCDCPRCSREARQTEPYLLQQDQQQLAAEHSSSSSRCT